MKYIVLTTLLMMLCVQTILAQEIKVLDRAKQYEPIMIEAGRRYGVDPRILWTIAYLETRFNPTLKSHIGARGMMQFINSTAQRYKLRNPHDPVAAVNAAARYLRDLQKLFDNRLDLILGGYNAGEGAVIAYRDGTVLRLSNGKTINPKRIKTGGIPPYKETVNYVRNGLALYLSLATDEKNSVKLHQVRERLRKLEDLENRFDAMPEEVRELKQGSIYIISDIQKSQPVKSGSGSIYINPK